MKSLLASFLIAFVSAGSALAQSVTVTSSATTYGSVAGQITLTVNFNFATPTSAPTAMAFEITAPTGWSYAGGYAGDIPAAKPVTGATGPLGFAFSDFDTQTPGKVAFSFKMNYDAGLSGTQAFPVTVAQYKDGVVGTVNLTVPNITFTSAGGGTVAVPVISSATTASATVGAAFSYTITATNTPSSFAAAGLPAGLSLNTTSGVISGTPTTAGTSNVSLTATNAGGTSAAATLVLTVNPPPPVISSATTASATVGTAFSYQITASNNPTSYAATGLPAGLSLNATTGAISGTPTTAGTSTVSLTATNAGGTSAVFSLSLTISNASPTSGPSVQITPSAATYTSVAGQITLSVTFNFATPTSAPTAMAFEITAPAGWSYAGGYSGDIPAAKPVTGATGPLGFAFSDFDTQTPGKVAFSFKVNYAAGLSGTQTLPVTVAQYKDGVVGTVNLTVPGVTFTAGGGGTVAAPAISSPTTAAATVGTAFSYTITASNTPSSFAATGLPAGLSLNTTTGVISGTPTTAGSSTVSLTATNSGGTSAAVSLVLTVAKADQTITFAALPAKTVGDPAFTLSATSSSGGAVTYTSSNSAVATISGNTVTIVGSGSTNIVASQSGTSNYNAAPSVTQSLTVNPAPVAPSITTQPQGQSVAAGTAVTLSVVASGVPTPAYQWRKGGGALSGATNSSYSIGSAAMGDAGSYDVVVTNSTGSVTSSAAVLDVYSTTADGWLYAEASGQVTIRGYQGGATEVSVPASISGLPVKVIGSRAFENKVSLVSITLPAGITKIEDFAFMYCQGLLSINLPEGLLQIGASAFRNCDKLTSIAIPASVTSISTSFVFYGASKIASISVAAGNANYSSIEGVLFNKAATTLLQCPEAYAGPTYVVPSSATAIGAYSFSRSSGLKSITISAGLTSIGASAFQYASQLTTLLLPSSLTSVGVSAFADAPKLNAVGFLGNSPTATTGLFTGSGVTTVYYSSGTSGWAATFAGLPTAVMILPSITTHPAGLSITQGNSASFSVAATGTPSPSFQWKNGTVEIAGATNSTYSISTTASGDAGSYFVTVSNVAGSVTSNAATLTVTAPVQVPVISSTTTASATVGTAFSYQIVASNSPTSYAATNLPGGLTLNATTGAISGTPTTAGTSSVSLTATNSGGTSAAVTLVITVNAAAVAPSITTQPQSQSVTAGASVTFSVGATGTAPLSYQWKRGGSNISGATNSSYTIPATTSVDAGSYFVTVSNSAGNATSNAASLTVTTSSGFAFSQQPVAITRSRGETASFQVNATGGTGTVTYKWFKDGTALSDSFGRISGSGTQTLVISNVGVADGGSYSATATTVQNGPITSNGAALTVLSGPTITRPALDAAVLAAGGASFSVAATGSGALTYQWYFTPAAGGTTTPLADITSKVAGATTSTLTVSSVQKPNDEGFYSCSVTDSAGTARSTGSLSVVSRVLKISAPNAVPGADVVVSVILQANGDENAANFAVVFDPSKLTYKSFAAGAQSDSGSASVPAGTTGRLNVLVGKTPPDIWAAGSNEIARITFTSAATGGTSLVGFEDISASSPRSVSSATGQTLFAGYQGAYVSSISGLEGDIDGDGKLTAADWTAMGRIVLGLDPAPTGEKFMRADCAPRTATGGALQLGDKLFNAADWTQVGRYVLGLDPVTNIGGPSGP